MIRGRQLAVDKVERHDLFTKLLEANDDDLNQNSLTEDELISSFSILAYFQQCELTDVSGNIYIFLLAGHEVRKLRFLSQKSLIICSDNGTYFGLRICIVGIVP